MTSVFGASPRPVCYLLDRQTLDKELLFLLRLERPPVARRGSVSTAKHQRKPQKATGEEEEENVFYFHVNCFARCEASTLHINIASLCDTNLDQISQSLLSNQHDEPPPTLSCFSG